MAVSAGAASLTTDGVRVTDTTAAPYRSIVYLESRDERSDRVVVCTGAFVGPNVVLTAASCLYGASAFGGYAGDVVVTPGRNGDARPYGRQRAVAWEVPPQYRALEQSGPSSARDQFDVGVVTLPDGSLGRAIGVFSLPTSTTQSTDRLVLAGYDLARSPATMSRYEVPAGAGEPPIVTIDGAAGMSGGAPIWRASDRALVGIAQGGDAPGTSASGRRVDAWVRSFVEATCRTLNCVVATPAATVGPPTERRVFVPVL
jgi:V8-like Glu-specific endopeptidase